MSHFHRMKPQNAVKTSLEHAKESQESVASFDFIFEVRESEGGGYGRFGGSCAPKDLKDLEDLTERISLRIPGIPQWWRGRGCIPPSGGCRHLRDGFFPLGAAVFSLAVECRSTFRGHRTWRLRRFLPSFTEFSHLPTNTPHEFHVAVIGLGWLHCRFPFLHCVSFFLFLSSLT